MVLVTYVSMFRAIDVILIRYFYFFVPQYSTVVAGSKWPIFAASACGTWVFSRIWYTIGYSTGDPAKVCYLTDTSYESKLTDVLQRNSKGVGPIGTIGAFCAS